MPFLWPLREFPARSDGVEAVGYSPDGRILATGDGRVRLWDLEEHRQLATLTGEDVAEQKYGPEVHALARAMIMERSYIFQAVAFSPDGDTVAAGCTDETIKLWNIGELRRS